MSPDELDAEEFLLGGDIDVEGRMPWSSNATFLVAVDRDGLRHRAIYKPVRGERPLWDFEPGLHRRECAAYRLSVALGLGLVPPTVIRDGPFGVGSIQWFVDADHSEHYFTILENRPDLHDALRSVAVFDLIANNTDRKSGHCLLAGDRIWAIDHGLCFSPDWKLRTVIWEFGGDPIAEHLLEAVRPLASDIPDHLAALLDDEECAALSARAAAIVEHPILPVDTTGHRYPWPLV